LGMDAEATPGGTPRRRSASYHPLTPCHEARRGVRSMSHGFHARVRPLRATDVDRVHPRRPACVLLLLLALPSFLHSKSCSSASPPRRGPFRHISAGVL